MSFKILFQGRVLAALSMLSLFILFFQHPTFSQPASEEPAAEAPAESGEQPVHDGGAAYMAEAGQFHLDPTAYVMILLSNLIIAVTIERMWVLAKNKGRNDLLVKSLTERLLQNPGDIEDLAAEVSNKKFGVAGRVAAITLKGWKHSEEAMQEYASTALMAEKRNMEKRLVILSTLGNNTPFIGLLGTVLGIMKAFRDLALQGDAGPAVVMKGISEALVATAFGLGVAIPCVIAYNALAKAAKDRLSGAEEISRLIIAIRLSVKGQHHNGKTPQTQSAAAV